MAKGKQDIFVFAHWKGMPKPQLIGTLSALYAKGRKAFSFEYDKAWLKSSEQILLDPDLQSHQDFIKENRFIHLQNIQTL